MNQATELATQPEAVKTELQVDPEDGGNESTTVGVGGGNIFLLFPFSIGDLSDMAEIFPVKKI